MANNMVQHIMTSSNSFLGRNTHAIHNSSFYQHHQVPSYVKYDLLYLPSWECLNTQTPWMKAHMNEDQTPNITKLTTISTISWTQIHKMINLLSRPSVGSENGPPINTKSQWLFSKIILHWDHNELVSIHRCRLLRLHDETSKEK